MTQPMISKLIKPIVVFLCVGLLYSLLRSRSSTNSEDLSTPPYDKFIPDDDSVFVQQSNKIPKLDHQEINDVFLEEMDKKVKKCPNYVEYSQHRHPPYSSGRYQYPYMRPAPKCRTFKSDAVEVLIDDLKTKIEDPDLVRLVENCLPNTLDTTILWHKVKKTQARQQNLLLPQSFIVTGDIHAEWLRDAARQLSVYQPLIKYDKKLKELILGAINTQAYYIVDSPYCNAFHPPPGSGVKKGDTAFDSVFPVPDWKQVFECKYEIDSLASFLTLTNEYFENSGGDLSFINQVWIRALEKLLIVLRRESVPSFDEETGQMLPHYYSFQRNTNIGSETLPLGGVGNPVNYGTGLIRSAFRPSDDATILQFFIPGNIHMLTELKRARKYFVNDDNIPRDTLITETVDSFIDSLSVGIEKYGIVNHPVFGKVYAYEVDGYGSATFMDDANIPSLLSIPDLGYTPVDDTVYQNTRKMILSKQGNPYYLKGFYFEGIGGPHIGIRNAWPMSLLMRMRTTDDDEEIKHALEMTR
ncbi:hypothetical protein G210_2408, partial [Candida maltosa Xu316]